jgi:hypothetical protein
VNKLISFIWVLSLYSCSPVGAVKNTDSMRNTDSMGNADPASQEGGNKDVLKLVDPKDFYLSKITVNKEDDFSGTRHLLTFEAHPVDGVPVNHVKIWLCPMNEFDFVTGKLIVDANSIKACPSGKECGIFGSECALITTKYNLRNLPLVDSGEVKLVLQPCIESKHSSNKSDYCGQKSTKTWYVGRGTSSSLTSVYRSYLRELSAMEVLAEKFRQDFITWEHKNKECLEHNKKVDEKLAQQLKWIHHYRGGLLEASLGYVVDQAWGKGELLAGMQKAKEDLTTFLKDVCGSLAVNEAEAKASTGCQVVGTVLSIPVAMLAEGVDPRVPAAAFSRSFNILVDPKSSVNKTCNVGKVFSLILMGYHTAVNARRSLFLKHRKTLIDAGAMKKE